MTTIKAGLTGAALGALIWATVMFVAPISAQAPGAQAPSAQGPSAQAPNAQAPSAQAPGATPPPAGSPPGGDTGSRGGPGTMGPGTGRDTGPMGPGTGRMGPGMMGRGGPDGNDPDITGPRGDGGFCQERFARMAQLRLERIQQLVRPTDEQRLAFEELRAAAAKAVEIARAACPTERPLTPPARMAAAERLVEARLQGLKTVRPALESFYKVLSDEQKIRWANGPGGRGGDERGRDRRDRWRNDRQDWSGADRERWRGWDDRFGERRPYGERWRDRGRNDGPGGSGGGWREERGPDWYDRFRGRGDDWDRGRDDGRWGGERRSGEWRERFQDWRDRFGFDGGRGRDPDRWDQRWHDDERGGSTGRGGRDERSRPSQPDEERL
ncbi:MAG: Spy/CpxP family protein refolding chaperone [Xanthobacteraceae bacterium]